MRDDTITPGVQDARTQVKDPRSPGSRGLDKLARDVLKNHPMRKWIDLVDRQGHSDDDTHLYNPQTKDV